MALVTGETKEAFDRDEMARKGPLDHGLLNIPLSKRGDIDKDIDRYKADKAKQDKAEAKETAVKRKTDKQEAKEMLAEHQEAILKKHGPKYGEKNLTGMFDQWQKWEPKKLIGFINKFKDETKLKDMLPPKQDLE